MLHIVVTPKHPTEKSQRSNAGIQGMVNELRAAHLCILFPKNVL